MIFNRNFCVVLLTLTYFGVNVHTRYHRSYEQSLSCKREADLTVEERRDEVDSVFTATVHRVYKSHHGKEYRAVVLVKRVIKGDGYIEGHKILVEGFGNNFICHSNVRNDDTRIFFVNRSASKKLRLASSLLKVTINNLQKASQPTSGKSPRSSH